MLQTKEQKKVLKEALQNEVRPHVVALKDVVKEKLSSSEVIKSAVEKSETDLAGAGRVLLRASGTEALVRVMVEASTDTLASSVAEQLAEVVKRELGS